MLQMSEGAVDRLPQDRPELGVGVELSGKEKRPQGPELDLQFQEREGLAQVACGGFIPMTLPELKCKQFSKNLSSCLGRLLY